VDLGLPNRAKNLRTITNWELTLIPFVFGLHFGFKGIRKVNLNSVTFKSQPFKSVQYRNHTKCFSVRSPIRSE